MAKTEATEFPLEGAGVAVFKIKSIDKLAIKYVEARDERMKLTEKECAARDALIDEVLAHESELGHDDKGQVNYRFDDLKVTFTPGKPKIKVRSADEPDDNQD